MGLSSSKQKTTSTSTATPYSPAQPYIDQGLSAANDVFQSQQGQLTGLADSALAGYNAIAPSAYTPSPFVTNAQNTAASIAAGSGPSAGSSTYASIMNGQNPALGSLYGLQGGGTNGARSGYAGIAENGGGISAQTVGAGGVQASNVTAPTGAAATQQFYADTLGGRYLNGNPYIDGIAQQATDAATKAANQRFGAAGLGAGLSSAYSDVVSRNVANASNQVRYQNYSDERSRQMTAAGQSDALFNADANRQLEAATGNANRDLTAQTTNVGNRLSADQFNANAGMTAQQANLGARLSGLAGLSGIDQQQFQNQLGAAGALGSAYAQDASTRLGAAGAADAQANAQTQQRLSALGLTNSLTDAQYSGITPALSLLDASARIPWYGVQALGGTLNTLAGRYGTTSGTSTQTSSPSALSVIGQLGSNVASAYAGGY